MSPTDRLDRIDVHPMTGGGAMLHAGGAMMRCAIGRSGVVEARDKREGDGATPLGEWGLRALLLRPSWPVPDRLALPWRWIRPWDGWCDAPEDAAYNRPVQHPYPASAERLWREDRVYDVILILSHNDDPVVPGLGSAIFWHLAREDYRPTEGCVAIGASDMARLLPRLGPETRLRIGHPDQAGPAPAA